MLLKKRTAYLLFFLAYIGSLVIEKPTYSVNTVQACMSYLVTILVHFSVFAGMIWANNVFVIPYLLEKRLFGWYVASLIILILLYTILTSHYNQFIHGVILHDKPVRTSSGFWDNFIY